jgi:hypothetical protein
LPKPLEQFLRELHRDQRFHQLVEHLEQHQPVKPPRSWRLLLKHDNPPSEDTLLASLSFKAGREYERNLTLSYFGVDIVELNED